MTREELEKLKQTIAYFGHWYDVIGEERVLILEKSIRYIEQLDKENGKLEGKLADLQSEYIELENFHNNEVKGLKDILERVESENVRLISKLAFTENSLNNHIAQIEELKKENVKLVKDYATSRLYLEGYQDAEKHYLDVIDSQHKLVDEEKIKVKEIIKGLLSCCRNYPQENIEKIQQAEQFLKENEWWKN